MISIKIWKSSFHINEMDKEKHNIISLFIFF